MLSIAKADIEFQTNNRDIRTCGEITFALDNSKIMC